MSALHELVELTADAVSALRALEALQELSALKLHSRSLACKDFSMPLSVQLSFSSIYYLATISYTSRNKKIHS